MYVYPPAGVEGRAIYVGSGGGSRHARALRMVLGDTRRRLKGPYHSMHSLHTHKKIGGGIIVFRDNTTGQFRGNETIYNSKSGSMCR